MQKVSEQLYSFGDIVKRERKKAGYNQKSFAEEIGVTLATERNWEQHRNFPDMDTLLRICDFFHCDVDYMLGRMENKTHDIAFICKKTGLSDQAVQKLLDKRQLIQFRIKHGKSPDLLDDLYFYAKDVDEREILSILLEDANFWNLLKGLTKSYFGTKEILDKFNTEKEEIERKIQPYDITKNKLIEKDIYINKQIEHLKEKVKMKNFHISHDFTNILDSLFSFLK